MPFKSKAQQGYLEAHPEILGDNIKEWERSTDYSKLPKKVKKDTKGSKPTSRPRGKFGTMKRSK